MVRPCAAATSSTVDLPRATSSGVTKLGNHPSARRPTRFNSEGAMPPNHTSGGDCTGLGSTRKSSYRKKLP